MPCPERVDPTSRRAREDLGHRVAVEVPVPQMVGELDEMVTRFRNRPLDAQAYTYAWMDALTPKVRERGRIIDVVVVIAVGANADDGHRKILGLDVITTEECAGWPAFLRGLVARGSSGTLLEISDAHPGLVEAIAAALVGATWHRSSVNMPVAGWSRWSPPPPGEDLGSVIGKV